MIKKNQEPNQNDQESTPQVIIVGGGLAGLTNAIHLSKSGVAVVLIEKNEYPKHKVCGEYISKEVLPYLSYLGIDPFKFGAVDISRFELSTVKGKKIKANLPLGGFGISRFLLDDILFKLAVENGVRVIRDSVSNIEFFEDEDRFEMLCKSGNKYGAPLVVGAYGKRSNLDVSLNRPFVKQKSPYLAVKSHYSGDFPEDLVALHNFEGGYCGVSKVENDRINICYLASYTAFKKYKSIENFQEEVLNRNPNLREILKTCQPIFDQPLTISQVSFLPKATVENHILMSGDSAGMIHPLCGNGMGMAIHSGLLLSQSILHYLNESNGKREALEKKYEQIWKTTFKRRLQAGKFFNAFFGKDKVLEVGINALSYAPFLLSHIIKQTHGEPLTVENSMYV